MRLKSLLMGTAMVVAASQASAFEWTPVSLYPNPSGDVTDSYFLENVSFNCMVEGVQITDVMPSWVDEAGNEIKALEGQQNPWGFDPTSFTYSFDSSAFKENGEYILLFPEGMLVDANGDKSQKIQTPYTLDIPELAPAMFDDFEVLSIDPDLTKAQAVWNDQMITINTNHNDAIGYTTLTITDTYNGEVVVTSANIAADRSLGDSSAISWEVVGSYKFFEDHVYMAEIVFYNGKDQYTPTGNLTKMVDKVSYEFEGRVEGYKYSPLTLESVEPAPMSFVISDPSQAVFTYTFSGPVTVYQAETPLGQNGKNVYPPSCLSSNEDKTVWTLDLSDDAYVNSIDALLTIYVYARDLDGYQLKGNWGSEGESCFQDEWECELGAFPVEIVVPAKEAAIERLTEVVVKSVDGIEMDWAYGTATIQSRNREALGELYYEIDFETPISDEVRFTQWIPTGAFEPEPLDLAQDGVYSIVFAHGCFLAGEQFESKQSHSVSTSFEISGGQSGPIVNPDEQEVFFYDTVAPENGSFVTSLEKIQLWYPDMVACEEFTVNVYNSADQSLVTTGNGLFSWDDWTLIEIFLNQPVSEAGKYEVVIPARVIGDDAFISSGGEDGICNPEIKLSYTVDPDGSAVVSVADASRADVYDIHGRLVLRDASAADMKTLSKGIYVVAGRKVVVK